MPPVRRSIGTNTLFLVMAAVMFAGSASLSPAAPPSAASTSFTDIADSKFRSDIVWLASEGITSGCSRTKFCPKGHVLRDQMATFLARALSLPRATKDHFGDDAGNKHHDRINRLAESGITSGCRPGRFCPSGQVTRAQMASFLARALKLPATSHDYFRDDRGSIHEGAINRIAAAGITSGCGTGVFCPSGAVTREQAAAFIRRALEGRSPAPTPLPPSSNTSGAAMPAGDLPGWTMVFADDFATDVPLGSFPSAVSSKWWAYPSPWRDTSDKGMYAPEKTVSIADSMMNIWLHTEDGVPLVAAPVPRLPGGGIDQLYGRYAVRFRADPIDGYKTAWLLWPESNVWPRDGEIDFPEGELDGTISAFMHRMNGTSGSDQDAYPTNVGYADWHTAVIEWSPSAVTFILDGTVIGRSTSRIPSTPMHWVLQTETSLTSTYPAPSIQGNVQIDWVVVWRYTP